jgi:iron complex outermembrane recepter protein
MPKSLIMKSTFIALVGSLSFAAYAVADAGTRIEVPAGDLLVALQSLERQADIEVVYQAEQLKGMQTEGLSGTYSAKEALALLLKGTPLDVRTDKSTGVMLITPASAPPAKTTANVTEAGEMMVAQSQDGAAAHGSVENDGEDQNTAANSQDTREDVTLEEITVTAQRRKERLIETPISIGVLSGESIDSAGTRGITDVLNQVGGVSLNENSPGNSVIAIRGVTSGAGTTTTAYYMDEVPFAFIRGSGLADTSAFDLSRIEVLRGPQGTLYGAAALGGVVRVITNDANLDRVAAKIRMRTSTTDDGGDNYGGDLALNVPLVAGKLAVRGVASYSELSGFIDSVTGEEDINDSEIQAYRLKATYQPVDNLTFRAGISRSKIDTGAPSSSLDGLSTVFSANQPDQRTLNTYNLISEYDGPSVSLLSSTSYLDYEVRQQNELLVAGTGRAESIIFNPMRSFAQELRAVSQLDGPWKWSAGAIYKKTTETVNQSVFAFFPFPLRQQEQSESYAFFGETTRTFDDRLDVTAGLRYFKDKLTMFDLERLTSGTTRLNAPKTSQFDRVTGRVVIGYKLQQDAMLYGSVATGFRSGMNQTPSLVEVAPDFPPLGPDSIITYEVGTKGRVLNGAVTYDTAIYFTDWKDIQQSLITPIGLLGRLNAGEAGGMGVDASVTYQPSDMMELHASIGWNDLTFAENVLQGTSVLFADGARLNDSPEWTGSLGGIYRMSTPWADIRGYLSGNFAYGSARAFRFLTANVLNLSASDSHRALKASVGIEGERWSTELYGDNLTNDDGAITAPFAAGAFMSIRQRPRTVGLRVMYDY